MDLHPYHRSIRRISPWTRSTSIIPAVNLLPVRSDPAERPSRRRPRRPANRWMPLDTAPVMARITVFQHGGHQRPVIHRGSKHSRFRFVSTKTETTQLGEGRLEEWLAYLHEIDTDIADYECHPYQFDFTGELGKFRYRPDSVRLYRDGRIQVLEVKRSPADLADPEYRERLAQVAELCRLCGWEFRVLFHADVVGPPARRHNVSALFTRRTMNLSRAEEKIAGRLVGNGAPIAWGDLRDRLAPTDRLHGDAVVERLLARGMLSTNLDARFTPDTILMPTRPFTGTSEIRL